MPKPRYTLCCETRLLDSGTGLVSYINVVDQLLMSRQPRQPAENAVPGSGRLFVSAVWTKTDDDAEREIFEYDTRMHVPGQLEPKTINMGEIVCVTRFLRVDIGVLGLPMMPVGDHVLVFENRIRRKGQSDWVCQTCELPVTVEGPIEAGDGNDIVAA
jgi:hypothetical protein